ncbi:FecR domain-containing protein [Oscillatoria amoena NRMC-F 0135]|nr:FecR domain-containing protein [Oscillatoria amoena NRMC-F 0135]
MITPVLIGKYLSHQCTPDEARMIEAWIGESTENKGLFVRLKNMWDETGQVRPAAEVQETEAAWQKVRSRVQQNTATQQPKRKSLSYILTRAAAAAIIILGVVSFYVINYNSSSETVVKMVEISTQKGEKRQLALADGSTVWLNAESTIKYPEDFSGSTREVYVDGEAYFEVKRDETKPFMVHTGELITKVLGTSFNVMAYPDNDVIAVALDEGKVAVYSDSNLVELLPGNMAVYGKTSHRLQSMPMPDKHNEWRKNVMDLNNVTLAQATATVNRWFNTNVVIDDKKLETCRITASFNNPTLDEVIEILSSVLPIEIEEKDGAYHIKGETCE